jgi:hypothetical protein
MSSNLETDQLSVALDGVIATIHMTLGRCRFESATLRSSGLSCRRSGARSSAWWAGLSCANSSSAAMTASFTGR